MASLVRQRGRLVLAFVVATGKRCWLSLGSNMPADRAGTFKERIEDLIDARKRGRLPMPETLAWTGRLTGHVRDVLEKAGLIDRPETAIAVLTLGAWLECYGQEHTVKVSSQVALRQARANLIDFFGADTALDSIGPYDAERYRQSLKRPGANRRTTEKKALSEATVRRRCRSARQFFRAAVRAKVIGTNPFDDIPCGSVGNERRRVFVSRADIEAVIAVLPDAEWRLIVSLARYAGLRCPSEILGLEWGHVHWAEKRLTIQSPKTEAYGGGVRVIPIYGDTPLEAMLLEVYGQAAEGQRYVITRYRDPSANLRTMFLRYIDKAGVAPWPRLWQNLRASRETELFDLGYPPQAVCYWQGHSLAISAKHYLTVRPEWYERASRATEGQHAGAELSGIKGNTQTTDRNPLCVGGLQSALMGPQGFEPWTKGL